MLVIIVIIKKANVTLFLAQNGEPRKITVIKFKHNIFKEKLALFLGIIWCQNFIYINKLLNFKFISLKTQYKNLDC